MDLRGLLDGSCHPWECFGFAHSVAGVSLSAAFLSLRPPECVFSATNITGPRRFVLSSLPSAKKKQVARLVIILLSKRSPVGAKREVPGFEQVPTELRGVSGFPQVGRGSWRLALPYSLVFERVRIRWVKSDSEMGVKQLSFDDDKSWRSGKSLNKGGLPSRVILGEKYWGAERGCQRKTQLCVPMSSGSV